VTTEAALVRARRPDHAQDVDALLAAAGLPAVRAGRDGPAGGCELEAWAASGGMALTGWPEGPPLPPPAPLLGRLDAVTAALAETTGRLGRRVRVDVARTLFGRAALLGAGRGGRWSAGGSCRLLPAVGGWVAVNLPRADDVDAVPALVGHPITDPWEALGRFAASCAAVDVARDAQRLGVPAAALDSARGARVRARRLGAPGAPRRPLLVVDLSAMWAGPVVAQVLGWSGARVVKVETPARPDGARRGPAAFFDWLHAGHESAAWDFTTRDGAARLRALLGEADVVVEASRPRALRQLGIDAEEVVAGRPGVTWVSITAYGRDEPDASRVGFGDDVAGAAGLVARDAGGDPVFCGDAVADPIAGLVGALVTTVAVGAGGGYLLDVPLAAAAAFAAAPGAGMPEHRVARSRSGRWVVTHGTDRHPVAEPRAPRAPGRAEPIGASTAAVLAALTASAR
jgi:CoA-transferase family III